MTAAEIETRRTDWIAYGHFGMTAYRIWKQRDGHRWFQMHEWKRADGLHEMGNWIRSCEGFTDDMLPVSDEETA